MLVGDLIYNDEFDVNCNYAIFDCTNGEQYCDGAKMIFSTARDGFTKPLDSILDMEIKYITLSGYQIVIEASR